MKAHVADPTTSHRCDRADWLAPISSSASSRLTSVMLVGLFAPRIAYSMAHDVCSAPAATARPFPTPYVTTIITGILHNPCGFWPIGSSANCLDRHLVRFRRGLRRRVGCASEPDAPRRSKLRRSICRALGALSQFFSCAGCDRTWLRLGACVYRACGFDAYASASHVQVQGRHRRARTGLFAFRVSRM